MDKSAVAAAFNRAAGRYDRVARFQCLSGERLMALAPSFNDAQRVLDAGCGTGYFSRRWKALGHRVTALDLAGGMLEKARENDSADRYLQADIERIPLQEGQVDLCFSNLAVQWCSSLDYALGEMYRVTRPGGQILFSTLAGGSLSELAEAWSRVDDAPHVNEFLSEEQIRRACRPYACRLHISRETEYFANLSEALDSLKGVGATHLHCGRRAGLGGRERIARLRAAYPQDQAGYPLSYQLVLGVITRE